MPRNLRTALGLVVMALVVLFTLQNVATVEMTFLFWSFTLSRALMVFIVFLCGGIVGWVLHSPRRRR